MACLIQASSGAGRRDLLTIEMAGLEEQTMQRFPRMLITDKLSCGTFQREAKTSFQSLSSFSRRSDCLFSHQITK